MLGIGRYTLAVGLSLLVCATAAHAAPIFAGTVYYTTFAGLPNVNKVAYSYDQGTQTLTLGTPMPVASLPGADGIIFAPNGDLLVGGAGAGMVYDVVVSTGSFTGVMPGSTGQRQASFHLSLDPSGTKFYTSGFEGPLDIVPLPFGTQGTTHAISGDDSGLTQVAFAPASGKVFYQDGNPNCCGNVGTINLGTFVTTRLFTALTPAHGIIFDSFTGLITMFGGGETATIDQNGANLKTSAALSCDFDQGAVDGSGHAFVADEACGRLVFLDYHTSGDITNPDKIILNPGFTDIDDVAPLSGPGAAPAAVSSAPTLSLPAIVFMALALATMGFVLMRRAER